MNCERTTSFWPVLKFAKMLKIVTCDVGCSKKYRLVLPPVSPEDRDPSRLHYMCRFCEWPRLHAYCKFVPYYRLCDRNDTLRRPNVSNQCNQTISAISQTILRDCSQTTGARSQTTDAKGQTISVMHQIISVRSWTISARRKTTSFRRLTISPEVNTMS